MRDSLCFSCTDGSWELRVFLNAQTEIHLKHAKSQVETHNSQKVRLRVSVQPRDPKGHIGPQNSLPLLAPLCAPNLFRYVRIQTWQDARSFAITQFILPILGIISIGMSSSCILTLVVAFKVHYFGKHYHHIFILTIPCLLGASEQWRKPPHVAVNILPVFPIDFRHYYFGWSFAERAKPTPGETVVTILWRTTVE